jgi:superfamily II DNA or RNA helicase
MIAAVEVTVRNRLQFPAGLPAELVERLKGIAEHSNPAFHKAKAMGFWSKERPVVRTWSESKGALSLPRGSTPGVRKLFAELGIPLELIDKRVLGEPTWANAFPQHRVELWDHQRTVVDAIVATQQGICRAPTGSGKTTAGIAAIAEVQLPALVLVWTAGLVDQWVERINAELGIPEDEIGIVGSGNEKWRPITVAMQQTLARSESKRKKATQLFGMFMCDEVQKFAANTFLDVVNAFPSTCRIGLSADERRKDDKEFLIYDMFGKVIADISRKDLEKKELVLPVLVRVIPTEFKAPWYLSAREDEDKHPDFTRLLEELVRDDKRNTLLMDVAEQLYTSGKQTLILTHRREQALLLRAKFAALGVACGLLLGRKENAEEFGITVQSMRAGKLPIAAGTYQAIGQGLDIKPASRALCATPIHSNKQFFGQVRGRICRRDTNKEDAELFYLWDQHVFGLAALQNLARYNDRKVVVKRGSQWVPVREYMELWARENNTRK